MSALIHIRAIALLCALIAASNVAAWWLVLDVT